MMAGHQRETHLSPRSSDLKPTSYIVPANFSKFLHDALTHEDECCSLFGSPLSSMAPTPESTPPGSPCMLSASGPSEFPNQVLEPLDLTHMARVKRKRKPKTFAQKAHNKVGQKQRRDKARSKKKAKGPQIQDAFDASVSAHSEKKFREVGGIQCAADVKAFPVASGAYIGLRSPCGTKNDMLADLIARGFQLIEWRDQTSKYLIDTDDTLFAAMAAGPTSEDWRENMTQLAEDMLDAQAKLKFGNTKCLPRPSGQAGVNRRGKFKTVAAGISFGGGQSEPCNLHHSPHNQAVIDELLARPAMQRATGYGSALLNSCFPKVYDHYRTYMGRLYDHDDTLKRPFLGSIFPAISINFGPQVMTYEHLDHSNLPNGVCWILANGNYDPVHGGHLILYDLKVVIEFPPGASILIPSACLRHGNVPIRDGETRTSITQYAAGGLFRYVDYGFRTWDTLKADDPSLAVRITQERGFKWPEAVKLFSKSKELQADRARYSGRG